MLLFNVIYHLKLNSTVLLLLTEVSFNVVSILDIRVVIANALFATILFQFIRRYLIFLSTPRLFEKKKPIGTSSKFFRHLTDTRTICIQRRATTGSGAFPKLPVSGRAVTVSCDGGLTSFGT